MLVVSCVFGFSSPPPSIILYIAKRKQTLPRESHHQNGSLYRHTCSVKKLRRKEEDKRVAIRSHHSSIITKPEPILTPPHPRIERKSRRARESFHLGYRMGTYDLLQVYVPITPYFPSLIHSLQTRPTHKTDWWANGNKKTSNNRDPPPNHKSVIKPTHIDEK